MANAFFCRKAGHLKKDCAKYKAWLEKKGLGNLSSYVCHQSHLVDVPENTWWVDSDFTVHVAKSMQEFLFQRPPH